MEVFERCTTQEWPGLEIREICGNGRGRGVISTDTLLKGQIVLDYHAVQINIQQGKAILATDDHDDRRSDYVFFGPEGLCLDGSKERCGCHPDMRTLGRLINWAENEQHECNLVPRYFSMGHGRCEKYRGILFVALRDINSLEELRFDYGDRQCKAMFQ